MYSTYVLQQPPAVCPGRGLGEDFFGADIVEGHVVSASGVEGLEDVGEYVVGRNIVKEGHAGGEFKPVRMTHQLADIPGWLVKHGAGNFPQMRIKRLILKVGPGFVEAADSVEVGDLSMPEPAWLRENIPHPVAHLAAVTYFLKSLLVSSPTGPLQSVLMCVSETRQIKCICHIVSKYKKINEIIGST